MPAVILTCFAGRRANLEVVLRYTDWLHRHGLIAAFHLWDFTRAASDAAWLPSAAVDRPYVTIMTPGNKGSWSEYYAHYTSARYPDHVIIKADDDVVFFDVAQFAGFIERTVANEATYLLAFPSIVNNGVCAHYQQCDGLIPAELGEFPYDTFCGKLWASGVLCQQLHEYFITHHDAWLAQARERGTVVAHPIGHRISINCFAITSRNLDDVFRRTSPDDEHSLSVVIPQILGRPVCVDGAFTVAHLAFYRQRETGLDEDGVRKKYEALAPMV